MDMQETTTAKTSTTRKHRQKKISVFELLNSHAVREFRDVDKNVLIIPTTDYQRDESKGRIAANVAMHFDVVSFHNLLVIKRANGELVVADGGTRLSGARLRSDISTVPCLIFSGLTEKQEGDVFLRVNCNRRKLQTDQQHHAELFSDRELAVRSQILLDQMKDNRVSFESLKTMRDLVKGSYSAVETVTKILCQIANDKGVSARVMKGLVRLEKILNGRNETLDKRVFIRRMDTQFHTFENVLNVVVKPRTAGDMTVMAKALAKTLRIKLPVSFQ